MNDTITKAAEPSLADLKKTAKTLSDLVASFDVDISGVQKKRAEAAKQLRAITGKIVTIELKSQKAA